MTTDDGYDFDADVFAARWECERPHDQMFAVIADIVAANQATTTGVRDALADVKVAVARARRAMSGLRKALDRERRQRATAAP